ncbi:MAG TPA: hypothetical protein VKU02_25140 [Gemmataceae bacterium]|nr:hypothetical protein [Gemmataceae bacterium]
MNREFSMSGRLFPRLPVLLLGLALLSGADEPKRAPTTGQTVVGKCVSPMTALLGREGPDRPWQICKPGDPVRDGEHLVALADAAIDSSDGAVRLSLLPDLAGQSTLPLLESAVVLHRNPDAALDFTLETGRVVLANQKKEPAQVRLHFRKETWNLTLAAAGTKVALVLYGRWPRGMPFSKEARAGDEPTADLMLFVLHGEVQLRTGTDQYALQGPRGPAGFHWDSVAGPDAGPQREEQIPIWARTDMATPLSSGPLKNVVERIQNRRIEDGLLGSVRSADAQERRIAVAAMGALDDLPDLTAALANPQHENTREVAISTLRHWIGRAPGQDQRLYQFLVQSKQYSANQAALVLQLLHSFGESDLARPATFETLIDYLLHEKLAIRQLAKWHLHRLVSAGRSIAFDPAGSAEARQRAYEQWKKLIPNGRLPPPGPPK